MYTTEYSLKPDEFDCTSSQVYVYKRYNIREVEREDHIVFECEEEKILKTQYIAELHDRQEESDGALQELILSIYGGE